LQRFAGIVGVVLCLSSAARAEDCVTAADLAQGIDVATASGAVYHYTSTGKKVLATMQVASGKTTVRYDLTFLGGLYLTKQVKTYAVTSTEEVVGGMDGEVLVDQFRYSAMPAIKSMQQFVTVVDYTGDANGPEIGPQPQQNTTLQATIKGMKEEQVKWGACTYRILPYETEIALTADTSWLIGGEAKPVDAADVGKAFYTRRMLYFPDLGFAVITKLGPGTGEQTMKFTNGLKGLSRTGG
jgi:hypothetical protein